MTQQKLIQITANVPISCYTCYNCKDTDEDFIYHCDGNNSVNLIDISDDKPGLTDLLLSNDADWEINKIMMLQLIEDDGVQNIVDVNCI